jgi:DNA repair protein RecN (Recombination protein N)
VLRFGLPDRVVISDLPMLLSLRIENFALIDHLELQLGAGLTVLTGETGAGKSIILDAIDAALGGKVTSRMIRTGSDRSIVEAAFRVDADLAAWLQAREIELLEGGGITCSREIVTSATGQRNRSRVNGVLMNKQQMEELRDRLVEITAQGQTVQIGHPPQQREWLDSYGGEAVVQQRQVVAGAYTSAQQALQALEKRQKSEQERLQQLDLFEYQLKELKAANLGDPEELDQLEQERNRLSYSVELQQQSYQIYQALYQNDSGAAACADLLGMAEATLSDMIEYDSQIQPVLDLVSNALALVEQAGREINVYGEGLEADPQRLQEVQERIVELKQICRKYGPTLAEAIDLYQRLQADVSELTGGGQSIEELQQTYTARQQMLVAECATLTQLRQTVAQDLQARIVTELKPLAMEKVQFQVQLQPTVPTALGADQVTFLFSPNPGEPLQPLTEIASGGEMSRFLLALQASFSQIDSVGTLVFDEIDVGVSGRVTQAIAEKLFQLSQHHQVLCVTHQPIVAAMADQHLRVSKQTIADSRQIASESQSEPKAVDGRDRSTKPARLRRADLLSHPTLNQEANGSAADVRTVVRVVPLDADQRREELAQLAGGQTAQEAIAFADSLLAQAANLRQARLSTGTVIPLEKADSSRTSTKETSRKSRVARKA